MALPPKIESRIGISAPAETVWAVMGDVADWPSWNPLYPKAEGALRIGEKLKLTAAFGDAAPRDFIAAVVDWIPNEQILWSETIARGWIKTLRYIEIEALTPESCIFSNGEQYQGFVAPYYMNKARRRALRLAFTQFCEVVRDRAEARWAEQAADGDAA